MRALRTGAAATALMIWFLVTAVVFADAVYIVQPGDTLYSIARRFGVTVQVIVQANNIVNPNFIYTNQQLVIPTSSGTTTGGTTGGSTSGGSSGGTTTGTGAGSSVYIVQAGDTLTRIALRYQTSVITLAAANGINNINRIFVGQLLTIPGGGTSAAPPPQPTSPPQQPTAVPTQPPAATAVPTTAPPPPTATPVPPPPPPTTPTGVNLLPNGSFENGWYNQNGVPELQMPNSWRLEWDTGATGFGSEAWDVYVRPEIRVLSRSFLPPKEHASFIYDGDHTVKVFKGNGAISVRFLTDVTLDPGSYEFKINVFPDLVVRYENGAKVWAPDELSGDVRLIAAGNSTGWILPAFGQRNTFTYRFTLTQRQTITIGTAIRGRFAIANNGWFIDDWSLQRLQ